VTDATEMKRLSLLATRGSLLERGLTTARARGPSDAELQALAATIFGAAGAGAAGTATAGVSRWRLGGLTKLTVALVVAGSVTGITAARWWRRSPDTRGTDPGVASPAAVTRPTEAQTAPRIIARVPGSTAPRADRARVSRGAHPQAVVAPESRPTASVQEQAAPLPSAQPAPDGADEELRLIGAEQKLLPGDPIRALALVREHERRYPDGLLVQEREVVAVAALAAIGQQDEARRRAERFNEQHPRSTYAVRMRQILAGGGGAR